MRNTILLIILMVSVGSAAGFAAEGKKGADQALPASQAQSSQSADEKAVRWSADEFVAAFNKGDAKRIAALWTKDCEYFDERGRMIAGRDAVEKEYTEFFRANPGIQMDASVSSVKILGPAVALEEGTTILKSSKGKFISRGYYNAIHVKEDGQWLMANVQEHASPLAAVRPKLEDLAWLIGAWTTDQESRKAELKFKWIIDNKFIELDYKVQDKKGNSRSGVQIIGQDTSSGELVSWSFFANGGSGRSIWRPYQKGWIVDSFGRMPDGRPTASIYLISRSDENTLGWKSMNRRIAGRRLKDTNAVTLKRKTQ